MCPGSHPRYTYEYSDQTYLEGRPDQVGPPEGIQKDILSMYVAEHDASESHYRIIFGSRVKYLEILPGIFGEETLRRPPDLFASIPVLPYGDWTLARITSRDHVEVSNQNLPGITDIWHPARFDILSLRTEGRLSTRTFRVTHPSLGGALIAKYARFPWEITRLNHETRIYRLIDGRGIGPEFVGHIHEHSRVIGFLLREVHGRTPSIGNWGDLQACLEALSKLHALGIQHSSLRRQEFLISPYSGEATLIDFEGSGGASMEQLRAERQVLRDMLTNR